ncbi:TetR/AcrR family transcriptional regulator [Streptomyces sp. 891-h]|uniref:TetR/AcrR family transcriptional regulator n=1 Tax=unclassified Streptomyces TaxID=2593676 RepID=UPI001FA9EBED|nr:TetR/AcrR family transcriptional regulator [Streptomyces sp. 891-h]UNZ18811.1 TetR/AcrR family transcriptional regulator [Streptomyces sp. 891-h]
MAPPPPPTAAERGHEVRQRLLRAGAELITERGWSAVSTRAVAERAEAGPGLVHYHFASLGALLRQAALGAVEALLHELTVLLKAAATPQEALERILSTLDAYSGTDTTSLLFTETYLAATRDEELKSGLARLLAGAREELAGHLREQRVPQPQETAAVLMAAVDGLMLHRPLSPSLSSAAVGPVLRRLLTETNSGGETA